MLKQKVPHNLGASGSISPFVLTPIGAIHREDNHCTNSIDSAEDTIISSSNRREYMLLRVEL